VKSIQHIIHEDSERLVEIFGIGGFTAGMKAKTKLKVAGYPVMYNGKYPDMEQYAFTLLVPGMETTTTLGPENLQKNLADWVKKTVDQFNTQM
jgi:hypothetical protein